ncbi:MULTISPECIES: DUF4145 domain-containing protein [unclassified Saccharothrix]|uniref:DUF4145 domain-containing protein n=1 Tax=unclassified Saccharothrix TaxID=2593673 RepID=UPI00307D184D
MFSRQRWAPIGVVGIGVVEPKEDASSQEFFSSKWRVSVCEHCSLASMWYQGKMVFPGPRAGGPAHPDMPASVRELYEEAAAVAPVSRRAGAALARATVERLIKVVDDGAPKRATLEKRIQRIESRVSTPLRELLDIVRVAGNGAVHVDDDPDEIVVLALGDDEGPALLELLLDAANNLVEELISRPRKTRALWERLPEAVRAKREAPPLPPASD